MEDKGHSSDACRGQAGTRVSEAAGAEGGICEDYLNFFQKVFAVL